MDSTRIAGRFIKKERLMKQMSQDDLAKKLNMSSRQHVSNIERGGAFSIQLYAEICAVLKVDVDEARDVLKRHFLEKMHRNLNIFTNLYF